MSGYFAAFERAVRGTAGDARPRPVSLFEDGAEDDAAIAETEQEIDAAPRGEAAATAPVIGTDKSLTLSVTAVAAPETGETLRRQPGATTPPAISTEMRVPEQPVQSVSEERFASATVPIPAQPAAVPAAASPAIERTIEHQHHHHHETAAAHTVERQHDPAASSTTIEHVSIVQRVEARPLSTRDEVVATLPQQLEQPVSRNQSAEPLVIEIGRIEVRLESEAPPAVRIERPRQPRAEPSLGDFLSRSGG